MNKNNLQQIFSHYIEKFEYINNDKYNENYKWEVAKNFRVLMDDALSKEGVEFAQALYKVKAATYNIIDNLTQPFNGLVEFAKKEPVKVKKMFLDLYSVDDGDLVKQEELIAEFFEKSAELLDEFNPGSYRFKQNAHSVSSYLFLYDPDHHYMYKAAEASSFADCIEFSDKWGTGNAIKLEMFYRMCDELVEEIKLSETLMSTDASRFDGSFKVKPEDLFEDQEKHMLAFDIIHCCSAYNLFDGIKFKKPKIKEKKLYKERKNKALELLKEYNAADEEYELLKEAKNYYMSALKTGTKVNHKVFGDGSVESIDEAYVSIVFAGKKEIKRLGVNVVIGNGILKSDIKGFDEKTALYIPVLQRGKLIESTLKRTRKALKKYEEYID